MTTTQPECSECEHESDEHESTVGRWFGPTRSCGVKGCGCQEYDSMYEDARRGGFYDD